MKGKFSVTSFIMSKVSFNAVTACTNFIFPNATAFLEMERRLKLFEYVALKDSEIYLPLSN